MKDERENLDNFEPNLSRADVAGPTGCELHPAVGV